MRKSKLLTGVMACALLFTIGCTKDLENNTSKPDINGTESMGAVAPSGRLTPALKQKLATLNGSLKKDFPNGLQPVLKGTPVVHTELRDMVLRALAVTPTPCDANTAVNLWLDKQLTDWDADVINFVLQTDMLNVPTYNAAYFENSSANQTFGVNGEYTQILTKTFKDLKRFWNIQSSNIQMVSMSGSVLRDKARLEQIYTIIYGLSPASAKSYAAAVAELAVAIPQYRNGDHPIFTFNAIALNGFSDRDLGVVPDKIAMGDGVMEGYSAIGYGDVAPQGILAHEFGHHIQYELGLFSPTRTPEGTRRTELMADAYAAYYLSHARGASMQWKRVQQFLQVFFNIGDCSFTSTGHHGTPAQRMASAQWAYGIANNAQKQGHILTAQAFTTLFEAKLPSLVQ